MPKLKYKRKGKRVSVWIDDEHLKVWKLIENKSKYVQLTLDDASGIMAWAILRAESPETYVKNPVNPADYAPEFNRNYPLDRLTANRLNKKENQPKWKPDDSPSLRNVL